MTEKEIRALLDRYYSEDNYLDDELDYVASKPTYKDFGLAIKESYLEYTEEYVYDE